MKRLENLNDSLFENFSKNEISNLNQVVGGTIVPTSYSGNPDERTYEECSEKLDEFTCGGPDNG